jgi:hypothetical protein
LQIRKAGDAIRLQGNQFAIQHCGLKIQLSDCLHHCREPIGPVMAVAGDKADFSPMEPRQQAIPIEFYFTDPVRSVGRVFD